MTDQPADSSRPPDPTDDPTRSPDPTDDPTPARRPRAPGPVQYKGDDLEAERGPGLGCFRFQLVILVVFIILTPLSVAWGWPEWVSAGLLFAVILLLLLTGQTIIFLLRLVSADRRGRRRPLASDSKTVGELEDDAGSDDPDAPADGDALADPGTLAEPDAPADGDAPADPGTLAEPDAPADPDTPDDPAAAGEAEAGAPGHEAEAGSETPGGPEAAGAESTGEGERSPEIETPGGREAAETGDDSAKRPSPGP